METIYQPALNPEKKPLTMIWLHGLGVDGSDFKFFQKELEQFGGLDNINMVLPSAPVRDVTAAKLSMPAWYDLYTNNFLEKSEEDIDGMNEAMAFVQTIIDEEREKNPDTPIILGGFSQGAAVALLAGLEQTEPLFAIVAFSGYVPRHPRFDEISDVAKQTPIFMSHGSIDSVIPLYKVEEGLVTLNQAQANLEFHSYPMMHEVCPDEVADLADFIQAHLARIEEEKQAQEVEEN